MSSILRALKKLEKDDGPSHGMSVGPGMAGAGRHREQAALLKGVVILIAFLVLALGGMFLIKKPAQTPPAMPGPGSQETASVNQADQGPAPSRSTGALPQPARAKPFETHVSSGTNTIISSGNHSNQPETTLNEATSQPGGPDSMSTAETAPEADQPAGSSEPRAPASGLQEPGIEKSTEPTKEPHAPTVEPQATGDNKIGQSTGERMIAPSHQISGARPVTPEFPEIDESTGLELQAISWAPDPKKSIAVINNRICREKETVNGFTIQQIKDDHVIVSNGVTTGKLLLKIR